MNILWFLDKEFDVAYNMSARLATINYLEKSNNVTIVTSFKKDKKNTYDINSRLIYLNKINLPFIKTLSHYYQHLKFLNKDIDPKWMDAVFVNSNNLFLLKKLIRLRDYFSFKLVLDIRSLPVESNYLKKKMNNLFFKKSLEIAANHFDGVTYITHEMKRYCENRYNLPKHKAAIWSSGVDTEMFKPSNLFNSSERFRFMYHGPVTSRRGVINVVKALDRLREYNIEFFLLGSGKGLLEIKSLVYKLGLENKVSFHNRVPLKEVPKYINSVSAGILPFPQWSGWNTSSPIKLFEYLACGKPVIVTKIPAHINVLNGKCFAFWAETSSPDSIAKAILEAYNSKNNFGEYGKEARNFVEKNYSWEKQLSELEKFLKKV